MVMHKDSKWFQSWQNFKDNNQYVHSEFSVQHMCSVSEIWESVHVAGTCLPIGCRRVTVAEWLPLPFDLRGKRTELCVSWVKDKSNIVMCFTQQFCLWLG